jgi:tRNA(fMet)-specific endonuclease VapC
MPATGRFLLDTNIVIALLAGDTVALSNLERAAEVFVPITVVGELLFGAAKSGRPAENIGKVEAFVLGRTIIPCDLPVARQYGRLRHNLAVKGGPIPENDIWIAATAICHDLILATRDRHFQGVDELEISGW